MEGVDVGDVLGDALGLNDILGWDEGAPEGEELGI